MKVVASFSILGDMVKQVGGDRVEVFTSSARTATLTSMSRRRPTPRTLSESKILFVNGLGLEGWMDAAREVVGLQGQRW